jgi:uncharacterized damage-inducible protein DinB
MPSIADQIVSAWRVNNRINLALIEAISDDGMRATLSTRGGRDVARQFAHLHDVRLWKLQAYAKDLAKDLKPFGSKDTPKTSPSKSALVKQLNASSEAIEQWLRRGVETPEKWRGFKGGVMAAFGYFVSHEGHHRGSILLTLKQTGHALPQELRYGMWDWDRM